MSLKERVLCVVALAFFAAAVFAYTYESRYRGLLPIVTYPLRVYAVPLVLTGLVLLVLALTARGFSLAAKDKLRVRGIDRFWVFTLAFLSAGFVMKIVGEAVHELLGHGALALLFGGRVTDFYISLIWPYEFSYVRLSIPDATSSQMMWVIGGGILVSAVVSYSVQAFLLWKKLRWEFSVPLFWLSFWCYVNATGYLIVGGVYPFGDVEELIHLGVLTSSLALVIGAALFLVGFFIISGILRRTLATFLKKKTRWWILAFWFIIPALVGLTKAGRGIFHILLVPFSLIPILLSYLSEFCMKRQK